MKVKPIEELSEQISFCKAVDIAVVAIIVGVIVVKILLEL